MIFKNKTTRRDVRDQLKGFRIFKGCTFTDDALVDMDLSGVIFERCTITDLSYSNLNDAVFIKSDLRNARIRAAEGSKISFDGCDLRDAVFASIIDESSLEVCSSKLEGFDVSGCALQKAVFSHNTGSFRLENCFVAELMLSMNKSKKIALYRTRANEVLIYTNGRTELILTKSNLKEWTLCSDDWRIIEQGVLAINTNQKTVMAGRSALPSWTFLEMGNGAIRKSLNLNGATQEVIDKVIHLKESSL